MDKAVILARGLGTRMRKADGAAALDEAQRAAAAVGSKAMMPIQLAEARTANRPFLDYVLAALADAGYVQVCLVIGPEHEQIRKYYGETLRPRRVEVSFAIQERPRGTADAVAAAEAFAGSDPFLVINSDNYYPVEALRALRWGTVFIVAQASSLQCDSRQDACATIETMGLAAFDQEGLVRGSNIPEERIRRFAVLEVDAEGWLRRVIEKPDEATLAAMARPLRVSMNCWRFGPAIFEACRAIGPSPRGELELADAVTWALARGERFKAVDINAAVLDLSSQSDIAAVAARLKGMEIEL